MKSLLAFTIAALLVIPSTLLTAQDIKQEVEEPATYNELPELVKHFIDTLNINDAKYLKEKDGEAETFEVKFNKSNYLWSAEFDNNGHFIDIEQLISIDELAETAKQRISQHLTETFKTYRITRLQKQYGFEESNKGNDLTKIDRLFNGTPVDMSIKYEVVVEGTGSDDVGAFEYLFSEVGEVIKFRKIERRDIDTIWY